MKPTGIVRKIDDLGRIVIPKELRDTMGIKVKDPLEIYFSNQGDIALKKYEPECVFCGSADDTFSYSGRLVCKNCLDEMMNNNF